MKITKILKFIFLATIFTLSSVNLAHAGIIKIGIDWSGSSFGNTAIASGFIKLDDSLLSGPGAFNIGFASLTDLGITISGAASGNGTFGLSDFNGLAFNAPSALDLTQEFIGQTLSNGCAFGTSTGTCGGGNGGDFNLFTGAPPPPNGTWWFQLTTDGGQGDNMLVTSMHVVPEPSIIALFGLGLLGLGFARRRTHN